MSIEILQCLFDCLARSLACGFVTEPLNIDAARIGLRHDDDQKPGGQAFLRR
jgi:hypothetical protein